jgi:hypothetical protein
VLWIDAWRWDLDYKLALTAENFARQESSVCPLSLWERSPCEGGLCQFMMRLYGTSDPSTTFKFLTFGLTFANWEERTCNRRQSNSRLFFCVIEKWTHTQAEKYVNKWSSWVCVSSPIQIYPQPQCSRFFPSKFPTKYKILLKANQLHQWKVFNRTWICQFWWTMLKM